MQNTIQNNKWQELLQVLASLKKVVIACSGGLDSRFLTLAAQQSNINMQVFHIRGKHIPLKEEAFLKKWAEQTNVQIKYIDFNPLSIKEVAENTQERCYYCKKAIFTTIKAQAQGIQVCDGTNLDDLTVYRPGLKALKELDILSPLVQAQISKTDIRTLGKSHGLLFPEQASQACLLTRYNYTIPPKEEELLWLDMLEQKLEEIIPTAFRLRCTAENKWELHIECEQSKELEENIKLFLPPTIHIVFMPSIRAYFDKY